MFILNLCMYILILSLLSWCFHSACFKMLTSPVSGYHDPSVIF